MNRRTLRSFLARWPAASRLPLLIVFLLVVAGFLFGVLGNQAAEALPRPKTSYLVALIVLLTACITGLTAWQIRLGEQAARALVDPRNRAPLIQLVQSRAINQIKQALHRVIPLKLALRTHPDAIEFPSELLVQRTGEDRANPVPSDEAIETTFEKLDQAMLLLGNPGAGKTTLLNELAAALSRRAERDPTRPIPVVLNLASWAARKLPLDAWLAEELSVAYGVNRRLGEKLVTAGWLLPLLDGLDEVPDRDRATCVQAINAYHAARSQAEGHLAPIVVCSRIAEAEALTTRLRLVGAIYVEPPTDQQVAAYLEAVDATDTLAALKTDPTLWDLLRSPLVLSILALTQRTEAGGALRQAPMDRMTALLDAYIRTMLTAPNRALSEHASRRRASLGNWSHDCAHTWLAWLASSMTSHDMSEFYLERLQPTFLASSQARKIVRIVPGIVGAILGAVVGIVGALIGGRITGRPFEALSGLIGNGTANVLYGLGFGLLIGAAGNEGEIRPAETLNWTPSRTFSRALTYGLSGALVGILIGALSFGILGQLLGGSFGTSDIRSGMLAGMLYFGWLGVLFGALSGFKPGLSTNAVRPNQGIWRSARHGLLIAALAIGLFLPIGLLVDLPVSFLSTPLGKLNLVMMVGGVMFLIFGGNAVLQHYALRLFLIKAGATPRRYVRFLEAAVDGLLLRRVGGGYVFPHRLVQERFASYKDNESLRSASRGHSRNKQRRG
jgi:hypothetical protein